MHIVNYNAITISYTMGLQFVYNAFTIQHCKRIIKYTMILQTFYNVATEHVQTL